MEQGSWDDYACTNSVTDHVLIANKCITGNNLMPTYMSYQFSTELSWNYLMPVCTAKQTSKSLHNIYNYPQRLTMPTPL